MGPWVPGESRLGGNKRSESDVEMSIRSHRKTSLNGGRGSVCYSGKGWYEMDRHDQPILRCLTSGRKYGE